MTRWQLMWPDVSQRRPPGGATRVPTFGAAFLIQHPLDSPPKFPQSARLSHKRPSHRRLSLLGCSYRFFPRLLTPRLLEDGAIGGRVVASKHHSYLTDMFPIRFSIYPIGFLPHIALAERVLFVWCSARKSRLVYRSKRLTDLGSYVN